MGRCIENADPEMVATDMFALVFMEWVAQLLKEPGIHIIIDGKALRGATEKYRETER